MGGSSALCGLFGGGSGFLASQIGLSNEGGCKSGSSSFIASRRARIVIGIGASSVITMLTNCQFVGDLIEADIDRSSNEYVDRTA
jgi:hypothetical protein